MIYEEEIKMQKQAVTITGSNGVAVTQKIGDAEGEQVLVVKKIETDKTEISKEEGQDIKIRYTYIAASLCAEDDLAYYETIKTRVLTLQQIENRNISLEEQITNGERTLIRILGRDRCTELKDINGTLIFEHDIIRWYPNRPKNHKDVTVTYVDNLFVLGGWYENDYPDTEEYCKVIGTEYGMV
jgi:hypothetical protein